MSNKNINTGSTDSKADREAAALRNAHSQGLPLDWSVVVDVRESFRGSFFCLAR